MKKWIFIIICCIGLAGCGDFLKEQSQQYVYASSCSDLDELLIGSVYMPRESNVYSAPSAGNGKHYPWLSAMDDDSKEYIRNVGGTSPVRNLRAFHAWFQEPLFNENTAKVLDDNTWLWLYTAANYANVIISQVDEYTDDPEETRNRVKGEAQFLRGAFYYLLNNIYAKPYVKETAATDLGVTLKTTEYVEDVYYTRTSNADVYKQIVTDLKNAAGNLVGVKQKTIYRVNEAAARTLLSRVYLYMGEWQACLDECNKVLELGCPLWDLNNFTVTASETTRNFILSSTSPEVFFTQGGSIVSLMMESNSESSAPYCVSDELARLYFKYESDGFTDLRSKTYLKALAGAYAGNYYMRKSKASQPDVFDAFVVRSAEVYLNKAEAEAMLDKPGEAVGTLTTLMEHRFEHGQIPDITALAGENLVKFIREERRRELSFECHRWFDLRRYAVSPKYPEKKSISHDIYSLDVYPGQILTTLTLEPYGEDAAWVMPIPRFEIEFNKGALLPNEERPVRRVDD